MQFYEHLFGDTHDLMPMTSVICLYCNSWIENKKKIGILGSSVNRKVKFYCRGHSLIKSFVSFRCNRKWRVWLWKSLPALTRIDRNLSTSQNSFTDWVMALSFHKNSGDVWQLECVAINQLQAGLSVERLWLCLSCHHLYEGHPVFLFHTMLWLTFRKWQSVTILYDRVTSVYLM